MGINLPLSTAIRRYCPQKYVPSQELIVGVCKDDSI
jgi:hypothetical protein